MYVVKMDGMKVRVFNGLRMAQVWAKKYCSGSIEIVSLRDTGRLPEAHIDTKLYADERSLRGYSFHAGVTVRTV